MGFLNAVRIIEWQRAGAGALLMSQDASGARLLCESTVLVERGYSRLTNQIPALPLGADHAGVTVRGICTGLVTRICSKIYICCGAGRAAPIYKMRGGRRVVSG